LSENYFLLRVEGEPHCLASAFFFSFSYFFVPPGQIGFPLLLLVNFHSLYCERLARKRSRLSSSSKSSPSLLYIAPHPIPRIDLALSWSTQLFSFPFVVVLHEDFIFWLLLKLRIISFSPWGFSAFYSCLDFFSSISNPFPPCKGRGGP